jgi:hypothetical protein
MDKISQIFFVKLPNFSTDHNMVIAIIQWTFRSNTKVKNSSSPKKDYSLFKNELDINGDDLMLRI